MRDGTQLLLVAGVSFGALAWLWSRRRRTPEEVDRDFVTTLDRWAEAGPAYDEAITPEDLVYGVGHEERMTRLEEDFDRLVSEGPTQEELDAAAERMPWLEPAPTSPPIIPTMPDEDGEGTLFQRWMGDLYKEIEEEKQRVLKAYAEKAEGK